MTNPSGLNVKHTFGSQPNLSSLQEEIALPVGGGLARKNEKMLTSSEKPFDLITSDKLSQTVPPTLQRLRYSTESGTPSVSIFGEQKGDARFNFGTDSIRTVDRIMVVSPPKPGAKTG